MLTANERQKLGQFAYEFVDFIARGTGEGRALYTYVESLLAAERERCAKICEAVYKGGEAAGDWPTPEQCAAAIRSAGSERQG